MSTVSFPFLFFFIIALILYYIVPKRLQWLVLLVVSIYFFVVSCGDKVLHLSLIFLSYLAINWTSAIKIAEFEKKERYGIRKALYIGTVLFNILLLFAMKDFNFFKRTANGVSELFGSPLDLPAVSIAAPLGISYFALILTGYVTDVYWGKFNPERNPLKFCLFGGFFPQLSSGPFVKYEEISVSLYGQRFFDFDCCVRGLERVLWGFFKKLVIAERLAVIVNAVYSDYNTYAGWYVLLAAVSFTLQLYTDFSGAIDIALGVSECFGVELPENFHTPFYSTGIAEFWRRWHITLGGWMRSYVFYPLQRSSVFRKLKKWCRGRWGKDYEKKLNLPMYLAMFAVWFLIGLWHGGGWNHIFGSGLYYWVLITASELCAPVFCRLNKTLKINTECFSWKLFQRARTFLLFTVGTSFFRAANLREGFLMWKSAFSVNNLWIFFDQSVYNLGLDRQDFTVAVLGIAVLFVVELIAQTGDVRKKLEEQNYIFRVLVLLVLVYAVVILGRYGVGYDAAGFIYEQF